MSHMWMSHVARTNMSCRTCDWVSLTYDWVMSHIWPIMSHIWLSHVSHANRVMSHEEHLDGACRVTHIWMSHVRHMTWVMSHMWIGSFALGASRCRVSRLCIARWSSGCLRWHMRMWDMTHMHMGHGAVICRKCAAHRSCSCVRRRIHTCDMTYL